MKKVLKILAIVLGSLFLLLLILPWAFRGRIVERVKQEINEQIEADVNFGRVGLSFIRQFPRVSLSVRDLSVANRAPFEGDTLFSAGQLRIGVNLFSMISGNRINIRSIRLDEPRLLIRVLEDGRANWQIVDFESDEETPHEEAAPFVIGLQRLRINNGHVQYLDDKYVTYIRAHDLNGSFSGDLSASSTVLSTRDTRIGSFSLRWDKYPLLSRVAVQLSADMDADLDDFVFVFRDNQLRLNDLPLRFDGMVGFPDDILTMDFKVGTPRSDFASFISLIPALYMNDFQSLQSSGNLQLGLWVKGVFTDEEVPGFGLDLEVKNGMFRYPDLPSSVDDVQILASVRNPGGDLDRTVVDISALKMNLGGNPVDMRLNLMRPVSDPQIDIRLAGSLDLATVSQFYPLEEGIILRGLMRSDMEARGRLSQLEAGNYGAFHARGGLQMNDLMVNTPLLDDRLEIPLADFRFSPQQLALRSFEMRLGETDLTASGRIDNILGYFFDGQVLRGSFSTRSQMADLNRLMEQMPESEPSDEPMQLSVIPVPANIDFSLQSRFGALRFGELELTNVEGRLRMADEQLSMENLRMNLMGGSLTLNGSYDTREKLPAINLGVAISGLDIQQSLNAFPGFEALAPVARFARGRFSMGLQLDGRLDETLSPLLESLSGNGRLSSSSVRLEGSGVMNSLADQLRMDQLRQLSLNDLLVSFRFADGKVDVVPFELRFAQSKANISGHHFLDQRIDYLMRMEIPRAQFGSQANQVLDNLLDQAAGRGINIDPGEQVLLDVFIGGTVTEPQVRFELSGMLDNVGSQLRQEGERLLQQTEERLRQEVEQTRQRVEDEVEQRVEDVRERVDEERNRRAQQVIDQADRRAAQLRREAETMAANIRREAREQARRMESEASGAIAVAAARRAGQSLIAEADRRADQTIAEAERNAVRIEEEARQQAARIRAGQE